MHLCARTLVVLLGLTALVGAASSPTSLAESAGRPVALARADSLSSSLSGLTTPGNYAGWKQTFVENFTGTALDPAYWSRYSGVSKSSRITTWTPSDVVVSGGVTHLRTTWNGRTGTAGAISTAVQGGQSYGGWLVRMRAPRAAGIYYDVALYPQGGGWPPEIDFAENGGGQRDHIVATLHYSSENLQIHRTLTGIDFSQWHTVGVITSPGEIEYVIDGRVWAKVKSSGVPAQKMWLTIQTEVSDCTASSASCPGSTPSSTDTQIDWVAHYTAD